MKRRIGAKASGIYVAGFRGVPEEKKAIDLHCADIGVCRSDYLRELVKADVVAYKAGKNCVSLRIKKYGLESSK